MKDLARSKDFYINKLGFKAVLDQPELLIFFAGNTAIGPKGPEGKVAADDQFDPFRIGLDHIALGCDSKCIGALTGQTGLPLKKL